MSVCYETIEVSGKKEVEETILFVIGNVGRHAMDVIHQPPLGLLLPVNLQ